MAQKTNKRGYIVVAIVVVALIIIGLFFFKLFQDKYMNEQSGNLQSSATSTSSSAAPEPNIPSPTAPTDNTSESSSPVPSASINQDGVAVYGDNNGMNDQELISFAQNFASALFSSYNSQEEMLSKIDPFLTDNLAQDFRTVDYRNLPDQKKIVGAPTIFSKGTSDALVDVRTNDNTITRVYIVKEGSLKVSDYGFSDYKGN